MRFQFKQSYNADINLFRDSLAVRDYLIVLAVFMLAPMVMLSSGGGSTLLDFGTKILIFSIAGLGMMILTGFTGVVSLGHAAFMLLGAYLYHYLLNLVGADTFGIWAIISGLITAIIVAGIGYLVARPALRMTGIFLSIASLLFFELVNGMLTNVGGFAVDKLVVSDTWVHTFWLGVMDLLRVEISLFERVVWWNPLSWLQGLYNALIQFDVVIAGRAEAPQLRVAAHGLHLYYVSLVLLMVGIWITRNITRSPLGRGLVAIRDSEVSARCMGIDVKHGKCLAMAISAGFTAIAGILFAYSIDGEFQAGKVGDGSITLVESIVLLLIVVVGGLGSIHGAILGAIAYIGLRFILFEYIINFEDIAHALHAGMPFTEDFLSGKKTYVAEGFGDQIRLFFGGVADYLAGVPVLGDILFGLLLIVILSYEPLGLFARYRKSSAYFDFFPFYRRNTFRRQRAYSKTDRLH